YMGEYRLVQVLNQMRDRFRDLLVMPDPGKHETHAACLDEEIDHERTLFLIVDQTERPNNQASPERYYICYHQIYVNGNPFHFFDENKPAWKAHTTIPHTLAGAMINLTRPWWPQLSPRIKVAIVDSFAGTGTVCLEALKFVDATPSGSD